MKAIKIFLFTVVASLLGVSCAEDNPDLSDIALFVDPREEAEIVVSSGDKTQYKIELSTIHDYVQRLKVTSFDNQYGEIVQKDSICNNKNIVCSFVYTAPEIDRDSMTVELKFEAWDNKGHRVEVLRTLKVKNRQGYLSEKDGIVLYNPYIGMPDAISLEDVSQPFVLATAPDSTKADIYIESDENFTSISWKSNTKTKFIRNNTFNYVSATALSIASVYQSSMRIDVVENIQVNDIILVGHDNTAEGVFQVKNIIRGAGNVACLQLSYKGIKR